MPTLPKSKLIPALVVVALLALPAAAQATLAYVNNTANPHVYVAKDNGKGARRIGAGMNPHVSPNGEYVAYEREGKGHTPEMKLYSTATGKTRTIFSPWRESFTIAWSPDSTKVAALRGGELGSRTLYVIDVETGKLTRVATGYFAGVSFSPNSAEIAFGLSPSQEYPFKSDIFRFPVAGGTARQLTKGQVSGYPLWGPNGQIAFVRQLGAKHRKYGPKNDLFLMNEDGRQVKRLTHTKVSPLTQGLFPTAWSESGRQLLAEYEGQDTSYAVTVDPKTGKEHVLTSSPNTSFVGVALTADAKTVLGYLGGFAGPGVGLRIATVPFKGGKPKVLPTGTGFAPSWGG